MDFAEQYWLKYMIINNLVKCKQILFSESDTLYTIFKIIRFECCNIYYYSTL